MQSDVTCYNIIKHENHTKPSKLAKPVRNTNAKTREKKSTNGKTAKLLKIPHSRSYITSALLLVSQLRVKKTEK